jgi:hypothetical protein
MDKNSERIMDQLADHYSKQIPQGARFDRERLNAAVWEFFHTWPSVNSAAKRIKETIDIKEVVVWD